MTGSRIKPLAFVLLLMMMALSSVGCQRQYAERQQLYTQNQELQLELDRARMALDNALAENGILAAENQRLRAGQATAAPVANQPSDTGFEDIDNITVDRTDTTVTVRVASDILFASGKIALRSGAKSTLNDVAGVLNSDYAGKIIRIEGYTDTDPIRKSPYKDNLELSLERAAAVHRYLQSRGIDPGRMYAAGYGEEKPLGSKAASRRVEIVVVLSE